MFQFIPTFQSRDNITSCTSPRTDCLYSLLSCEARVAAPGNPFSNATRSDWTRRCPLRGDRAFQPEARRLDSSQPKANHSGQNEKVQTRNVARRTERARQKSIWLLECVWLRSGRGMCVCECASVCVAVCKRSLTGIAASVCSIIFYIFATYCLAVLSARSIVAVASRISHHSVRSDS